MKVYSDPRRREGYWRVKLPDGRYKTLQAKTHEQACLAARALIASLEAPGSPWLHLVNRHIHRREEGSPELRPRRSGLTRNMCCGPLLETLPRSHHLTG